MVSTRASKISKRLNTKMAIRITQTPAPIVNGEATFRIMSTTNINSASNPNSNIDSLKRESSGPEIKQELTIVEKLPLFRLRTATIVRLVQHFSQESRSKLEKMSPVEKTTFAKEIWQKITDITNSQVTILRSLNVSQAMTIYAIYQHAKYGYLK